MNMREPNKIDKVIVFIVMPLFAIMFIVFGCYCSKVLDAFYLGLTSVLTGILWFNWAIFESKRLK